MKNTTSKNGELLFDLHEVERTQLLTLGSVCHRINQKISVEQFLKISTSINSLEELMFVLGLTTTDVISLNKQELAQFCTPLLFMSLRFNRLTIFDILLQECSLVLPIAQVLDIDGNNLLIYAAEYITSSEECHQAIRHLQTLGCDIHHVAKNNYTMLHAAIHSLKPELVKWCLEQDLTLGSFRLATNYTAALNRLHLLHRIELAMLNTSLHPIAWAIIGGIKLIADLNDDCHASNDVDCIDNNKLPENSNNQTTIAAQAAGIFQRLLQVIQYCGGLVNVKSQDRLLLLLSCACLLEKVAKRDIRSMLTTVSLATRLNQRMEFSHLIASFEQLLIAYDNFSVANKKKILVNLVCSLDEGIIQPIIGSSLLFFLLANNVALCLKYFITYKKHVAERFLAKHGTKIFMAAACNGELETVNILLAIISRQTEIDGYNAFMLAAASGCILIVRAFLEQAQNTDEATNLAFITATDALGRNAFMLAVIYNQEAVARELLVASGMCVTDNI